MSPREAELDQQIREWPRTAQNDAYKAGVDEIAKAFAPKLGGRRLVVAYNEFCAPSVETAIEDPDRHGVQHRRHQRGGHQPGDRCPARKLPHVVVGHRTEGRVALPRNSDERQRREHQHRCIQAAHVDRASEDVEAPAPADHHRHDEAGDDQQEDVERPSGGQRWGALSAIFDRHNPRQNEHRCDQYTVDRVVHVRARRPPHGRANDARPPQTEARSQWALVFTYEQE